MGLKRFHNTQAKSIIAHASIRVNKNLRVSFCLSPCKLQIVLLQVFLHNSFVCFAVLTRVLRKSVENSRKTPLKFPIVFCQKSFISERFRCFFGKLQFQINRHNFLPSNLLLEVIHIFHVLFHTLKTLFISIIYPLFAIKLHCLQMTFPLPPLSPIVLHNSFHLLFFSVFHSFFLFTGSSVRLYFFRPSKKASK